MNFLFKKIKIFKKEVAILSILWFVLALLAAGLELGRHTVNDYLIFKGVFWHLWEGKNLYAEYPAEYFDTNHYGPVFAFVIAPFALLPTGIGGVLWNVVNAWALFYAVQKLPFSKKNQLLILAICLVEMMTAAHNLEFNSVTAAWLILSFVLVEKERDVWAAFFIALGFWVKLYGICGLLFFAFSKHKLRFAGAFLFWTVLLFCLPVLLASPKFVLQSYGDWYASLVEKNGHSIDPAVSGAMQDISVMGMGRRIFGLPLQNIHVLFPATGLIAGPLFRRRQYMSTHFRLGYLAIVLISVVIFSTAAESPTYVIAMAGVAVWYVLQQQRRRPAVNILLALALLLTSLSPTDLFPQYVNVHYVRAYSLKALPPFVVWLWLLTDAWRTDFCFAKRRIA